MGGDGEYEGRRIAEPAVRRLLGRRERDPYPCPPLGENGRFDPNSPKKGPIPLSPSLFLSRLPQARLCGWKMRWKIRKGRLGRGGGTRERIFIQASIFICMN